MLIRRALMTATALVVPTTALAVTPGLLDDDLDLDDVSPLDALGAAGTPGTTAPAESAEPDSGTTLVVERRHVHDDELALPDRRVESLSAPTITVDGGNNQSSGAASLPSSSSTTTETSTTTTAAQSTLATAPPDTPAALAGDDRASETDGALVTPTTVPGTFIDIAVHPGRSSTETPKPVPANQYEERGFEALERIDYPWRDRLPDWEIQFSPGRSGVYGYTYTDRKVIEVFVRDGQPIDLLAHVIAHELGHAVDVSLNNSDERRRWQDLRGIADAPWWPNSGATDFSTGAGDFAESFAAWQIGGGNFRSRLSSVPDADELALLELLSLG